MNTKKKIFLFIGYILLFTLSCCIFSYGKDYYWHVKIGEYIFTNKTIPLTDIFSWYGSLHHLRWISHEWLFEIMIYIFTKLLPNGAFIYVFSMILIIGSFIFYINKNTFYKFPLYAIIYGLIGCLMFGSKILPRPHIISYLFFMFTLFIAYDLEKNENSYKFIFSFPIAILWSNCHGGSSNLSYFVYFVFFFCSFFSINKSKFINEKRNKKLKIKYLLSILLSIFGILINPHGTTMLFYPYQNMGYKKMMTCIAEWQSINIFKIDGAFYAIFIICVVIIMIKTKKQIKLINILFFLFFTILGIKSTKLIPYLYICCSYFIFDYINGYRGKINIPIIVTFICIINLFAYKNILNLKENNMVSNKIINYLKNNNTTLFNDYDIGGFLIYKEVKPFIDGRADLYIDTIFNDSCDITLSNPSLLEKYNFDTFLVSNHKKPYQYLKKHTKYKLIIKDKDYSLFTLKPE